MTNPAALLVSQYRQPQHAQEYDRDRFGGRFGQYLELREIERFAALLNGHSGSILDAGGGTGKLSLPLLRQGRRVVTADFSPQMLTIARNKARAEQLPGAFAVADVRSLCYADLAFDSVVCSRVLMHLCDWRRALVELCRVTSEVLIVDFPPPGSFARLESLWKRWVRPNVQGAHRGYTTISPTALARELERHGFAVQTQERGFLLPVRFHRWLGRPRVSEQIERVLARTGLTNRFGAPVTIKALRRSGRSLAPLDRGK